VTWAERTAATTERVLDATIALLVESSSAGRRCPRSAKRAGVAGQKTAKMSAVELARWARLDLDHMRNRAEKHVAHDDTYGGVRLRAAFAAHDAM
jgi:hypothetical protein